jgi:hypothetical protein
MVLGLDTIGLNNSKKNIDDSATDSFSNTFDSNLTNDTKMTNKFISEVVQNIEIDSDKLIDLVTSARNVFRLENITCPGDMTIDNVKQEANIDIDFQVDINSQFKIILNNAIQNSILNLIEKDPISENFQKCIDSNQNILNTFYSTSPIAPADSSIATAALQTKGLISHDSGGAFELNKDGLLIDPSSAGVEVEIDFSNNEIDNSRNRDITASLGLNGKDLLDNTVSVDNLISQELEKNEKIKIENFIETTNDFIIKDIICGGDINITSIEQKAQIKGSFKNFITTDIDISFQSDFVSKVDTIMSLSLNDIKNEFDDLISNYKNSDITLDPATPEKNVTIDDIKNLIIELFNYFDKDGFIKYFEILGRYHNAQAYAYSFYGKVLGNDPDIRSEVTNKVDELATLGHLFTIIEHTPESLYSELEKGTSIDFILRNLTNEDLTNGSTSIDSAILNNFRDTYAERDITQENLDQILERAVDVDVDVSDNIKQEKVEEGNKTNFINYFIIAIIILLLIGSGIYYFMKMKK